MIQRGSGLILIGAYIFLALVGEAVAYYVGRIVEARDPSISLVTFLTMFVSVLLIAWPIAVRATRRFDDPVETGRT